MLVQQGLLCWPEAQPVSGGGRWKSLCYQSSLVFLWTHGATAFPVALQVLGSEPWPYLPVVLMASIGALSLAGAA